MWWSELSKKDNRKIAVKIYGKILPLNPFVQNILRKTVLTMISTLRDTEIQGNENVEINVNKATA